MARPQLPPSALWQWQTSAAFLDSQGDWWVNTQENVYRYSGVKGIEDLDRRAPSETYNDTTGLISGNTLRVFEDSRHDLWFSTWVDVKRLGLSRWQRSTGRFQHFFTEDGLPQTAAASAFAEDNAGNLWFGFIDGGVARYRDGRFTLVDEPGMPTGGVTCLYKDGAGRIWMATSRDGLSRVDEPGAEHPTFRRYTIADGLTSNNVRCITEDLYGNIYVGTVRGVNRLSPDTGRVKYYGTADGLASDFINTAYRDRQGAIWFGTFNGLSRLVPEPDAPLPPPAVFISALRIAGTDYALSPLGQAEVQVPEQSADQNNVQVDFFSISTGDNATTAYQYRLEGSGADWSPPSAERSITFANLSPGHYRFEVRAVNADGVVSPRMAFVSFTILRPVWRRWWFLSLAALTLGLAVYALYRYRLKRLLELERVRTRIATDLHDDIGSNLSLIAMASEVARQQATKEGSQILDSLALVSRTSRQSVDAMSDIVWAVNPKRDHLHDLTERMQRFASDSFSARDIEFEFTHPDASQDIALHTEIRRQVYLIFKECVNNIAKHAECREVMIEMGLTHRNLELEIRDDGKGFDARQPSNGYGGNGLSSMRERAAVLGAVLKVESRPGEGTTVRLNVPLRSRWP